MQRFSAGRLSGTLIGIEAPLGNHHPMALIYKSGGDHNNLLARVIPVFLVMSKARRERP